MKRNHRKNTMLLGEILERRDLMSGSPIGPVLGPALPPEASDVANTSSQGGLAVVAQPSGDWFATVRRESLTASPSKAAQGSFQGQSYAGVRNQWIVQLTGMATERASNVKDAARLLAKARLKLICGMGMPGWVVVNASGAGKTALAQEKALQSNPNIAHFAPNMMLPGGGVVDAVNDPLAGQQYGLETIDAPGAWRVSQGSRDVTVAVIDSGVDWKHPDLAANMWRNPGEIPGNRRDDDGNGFVDDVYGWDFVANDSNPMDEHGHGTHVAGILGAVGNNGQGIVGVSPEVSIMAVRGLDANKWGSFASLTRAINYVTMMKSRGINVPVINASWFGYVAHQPWYDAIASAGSQGILFVASAGNDGLNLDQRAVFPAAYDLPNILSVAASDQEEELPEWSNFGVQSVDLCAPGVEIVSTLPGKRYDSWSGTSMAAPHVAGVAALLTAMEGPMSVPELRSRILESVDVQEQLIGRVATGGRLNAARALGAALGAPAISITDARSIERDGGYATLAFGVTLSGPSRQVVTVSFATANDTAAAGEDYLAVPSSTITFHPGETRKDIAVTVVGDVVVERDEHFYVRLSNPANATIADGEGLGTIVNDDAWLAATNLAVFRGREWHIDLDGSGGPAERVVGFGLKGDRALVGDWNGDGRDELWVVRDNSARGGLDWYLDLNGDGYLGELVLQYGLLGDIPMVGDFDGDGRDELAVVRQNHVTGGLDWYLDLGRDGYLAERVVGFGLKGDVPQVGDFDGNGRDDLAVVRFNAARRGLDWHIDLAGDGYLPEKIGRFGLSGDLPVTGDWNGDGKDDFGVVRGGTAWWLDMAGDGDYAEKIVRYGLPGDQYLAGKLGNSTLPSASAVDAVFAGHS